MILGFRAGGLAWLSSVFHLPRRGGARLIAVTVLVWATLMWPAGVAACFSRSGVCARRDLCGLFARLAVEGLLNCFLQTIGERLSCLRRFGWESEIS